MSYGVPRWLPRHRRVLMVISAAGIAAALVAVPLASTSAASSAASPVPAAAASRLSTIMLHMAEMSGDAQPASIEAVTTARDQALRVVTPGDTVPGSAGQNVYLVVMKGDFTLNDVPVPPHAHAPTGHYLAVTFDPATFQIMDLGISDNAPPVSLGNFGPVSNLTRQE